MFSRTCFVVSCFYSFENAGYRLRPFGESPLRLILLFLKLGLNEERLLLLCVPASL